MKWLSEVETSARLKDLGDPRELLRAYALSLFADHAFYAVGFQPSSVWSQAIILTESGEQILTELRSAGLRFAKEVEHFTLFRLFYHRELLINYGETDLNKVQDLLSELHKSGSAHWAYVFGNLLYHKFNDSYDGNRTDSLDPDETGRLLAGTPQGVFQVGCLVSGPLGFLQSVELRTVRPTLSLPLWHCSDPGCLARHLVRLKQHHNECEKARTSYLRCLVDNTGPRSEWGGPILRSYRRGKYPNGRPYCDLPAVLADCIVGRERASLCLRAMRSPYNERLSAVLRDRRNLHANPETLVSALSTEEQHQLLLLLSDRDIVHFIDELVCGKQITIPPSELRSAQTYAPGSSRDNSSLLSSLGMRSTGHPPIVELAATIWSAYDVLGISKDLDWRLRGQAGPTHRHSVVDFIRTHGPATAVRELILSSREVTTFVAEQLTFAVCSDEPEKMTVDRLLWKFGFDIARYEDEYAILRSRLAGLRNQALQLSSSVREEDREKIRAVGVNLFVSVEQFLEDLVSYNVWLLASDHFTDTRFCFTKQEALLCVPRVLGDKIPSGDETFRWRPDGANTLGVLLRYLHAFRTWLKDRPHADKTRLHRRAEDFPHYSEDTLYVFPYQHTELWADIPPEIMAAYTDVFDKICVQVSQADLAVVRDGLDHKRQDDQFPNSDKILACVSRLQEAVDTADRMRVIPKLLWGTKREQDADGNVCYRLSDYRNETVSLWDPSPVVDGSVKLFGVPNLIAPFDFLNLPNSILAFEVHPRTEYREYWKNYPRRRVIPSEPSAGDGSMGQAPDGGKSDPLES